MSYIFRHLRLSPWIMFLVLVSGTIPCANAQVTLQNATLFGTITDASGAAVPEATVEVTSPALQGSKTTTTDSSGNYRIPDLPAGSYHIAYSKVGFQTDVRNDFTLTAGFNARVDVALQVGATTQTVEVTGQAPLIDTSTTVTSTDLGRPTLDAVPTTRSVYQAAYMAPGIRPVSTPDVGGSTLGMELNIGGYGYLGGVTLLIDGIMGTQATSINGTDAPGNFVDYDSLEEFRVISTAADADVNPAGPVIMTIMKSGGNDLHGDAHAMGEPHWFQLTNLPGTVTGASASNQLEYFWDVFGDVGGRIIKDKLWFYTAVHLQRNSAAVFGYKGPSGGQGYTSDHQDNSEAKVTYQATKNVKLIGDYTRATQVGLQYFGTPSLAYPSNLTYFTPFFNFKGEVTWTPNSKWLFDALGGLMWQSYSYPSEPGQDVAGNPYTFNETTGITTGAYRNLGSQDGGSHRRHQYTGSVSYFPNGKHSFQWGSQLYLPQMDIKKGLNHPSGNYELLTENVVVGGVTNTVPYELNTWNYPFVATGKQRAIGIYGKDTWRLTNRLTLNYGARFDNNLVYNNAETEPAGPFSLGGSYPYQRVEDRSRISPRVGVAYDLTGSGKTVIRGSYGIYNVPQLGVFDLTNYNPAAFVTTTYNWAGDTCQATAYTACAPSAAFLNAITASLANPSATTFNGQNIYVTTTGGVFGIINPNLRIPFFHTATATVERALGSTMSLRVLYVANIEEDMFDLTFPNRPPSDYTQSFTTTYPASDPINGNKPITILYYPSSLKAGIYNDTKLINRTGHPDFYQTAEVTVTRRKVNKWSALATLDLTKSHEWLPTTSPAVFASGESADNPVAPYQAAFPLNLTWDWAFKSYFTYDLPYRITFGINYQLLAGAPNYNTDQFSVPTLGTIYIPVNQFGTRRAAEINDMNLRFGRIFAIKEHDTLEFTFELFNALNVAPGTTVNWINGTGLKAPGYVSVYMHPMIGRISAQFKF